MRYRHHQDRLCFKINCWSEIMRWMVSIKRISMQGNNISRQSPQASSREENEDGHSQRKQLKHRRRRWWQAKELKNMMKTTNMIKWLTMAKVLISTIRVLIMKIKRIDRRARYHLTIPTCRLPITITSLWNTKRICSSFWVSSQVRIHSSRAPTSSRNSWSMISPIMTEWSYSSIASAPSQNTWIWTRWRFKFNNLDRQLRYSTKRWFLSCLGYYKHFPRRSKKRARTVSM